MEGLRAIDICVSAIVLLNVVAGHRAESFCRFWKSPGTGEVLPKFLCV
jgi:hypothetical protein